MMQDITEADVARPEFPGARISAETERNVYVTIAGKAGASEAESGDDAAAFSGAAFVSAHEASGDGIFDFLRLESLSNKEYLQAVYEGLLGRFPDDDAMKRWLPETGKDQDVFRRELVQAVERSAEFENRRLHLRNNIYGEAAMERQGIKESFSLRIRKRAYGFYKDLPEPLKNTARKLLRRI